MTKYGSRTDAVHVGQFTDMSDSLCEPIALTSAYVFKSAADAAGKFSGAIPGNVYSRFTNPTVAAFEKRLAAMDASEDAVAFASGMAAISGIGWAWLKSGDNVVCSRDVFGTTLHAFRHYFGRFSVDVRVVDLTKLDQWEAAIDSRTRLGFLETPSNPIQQVGDIAAVSKLCRAVGALTVVDNTMLTPVFQRPLALGADLVVHSAGKYIDGHGRCVAGAVTGDKILIKELRGVVRTLGATLSSMNAWLLLKSLETLELRVRQISKTALQLAEWLQVQPGVCKVHYSGLHSHPQHGLATRQQSGHGGVLSFEVGRSQAEAWRVVDALKLISIATNIGDTRSMVTHPATTTHGRLSPEDRQTSKIGDGLLRLSVGLECIDDLKADIGQALLLAVGRRGVPPPDRCADKLRA